MEKTKLYPGARYSADVLKNAVELYWRETEFKKELDQMTVEVDGATWTHDDLNEFLSDYRRASTGEFAIDIMQKGERFRVVALTDGTRVLVKAPTRGRIEKMFSVFETNYAASVAPLPPAPPAPPPVVFIGHGRNPAWREEHHRFPSSNR